MDHSISAFWMSWSNSGVCILNASVRVLWIFSVTSRWHLSLFSDDACCELETFANLRKNELLNRNYCCILLKSHFLHFPRQDEVGNIITFQCQVFFRMFFTKNYWNRLIFTVIFKKITRGRLLETRIFVFTFINGVDRLLPRKLADYTAR